MGCGWACLDMATVGETVLRRQLVEFACQFGKPVATRPQGELCEKLMPIEVDAARPRSLSKIHSLGEFPLHVDTAHWLIPCRYVLLACVSSGSGERPTLLLDTNRLSLSDDQAALLLTTPLRIVNGRNSFFSTILSRKRSFVRFDPGCMMPIDATGAQALEVFSRKNWADRIEALDWKPGRVLVMNN